MKIPFIIKYDSSVEQIKEINERKIAIENKIYECRDLQRNPLVGLVIIGVFGILPSMLIELLKYIFNPYFIWNIYEAKRMSPIFCFSFFIWYLYIEYNKGLIRKYKRLLKRINDESVESIKEKVDEDVFENSIKLSYKYLDEYYSQTRAQAQNGFYITVFVAVFGSLLIASGIIIMFLGKTDPAYVTCAAGVITEFISSIFFYLYNKTITSMRNYHDKLVLSQNVSIALKVAESIENEERTNAKIKIVDELLKNINSYLVVNNEIEDEKNK